MLLGKRMQLLTRPLAVALTPAALRCYQVLCSKHLGRGNPIHNLHSLPVVSPPQE